jgi:hypothetical protein
MELNGHIHPSWNIESFYNLDYKLDVYKDSNLINDYEESGHYREEMKLYNVFEPSYIPNVVYKIVLPEFNFITNISLAVNLFKPGQYLPYHKDIYGKYKDLHNLTNESIIRIIVMLENGMPGQILEVGDKIYSRWKAGDWFGWINDEKHASYNFSNQDRYALQITGTVIDENKI